MTNRIILVFLLSLHSIFSQAQIFLNGKIVDKSSEQPVAYANISINSTIGTASNEHGEFHLKIGPEYLNQHVNISCIGYSTVLFSIDSLVSINQNDLIIQLTPFTTLLEEVEVEEKRIPAFEIVDEAIREIPNNYIQKPFNMEFYSQIIVKDESKTHYLVETIVDTYRQGYVASADNISNVLQKRTTGESPLKEAYDKNRKIHYFPYEKVPVFNISMMDVIGVGNKYNSTIFNPEYINKVNFQHKGISIFENDTVIVIEYRPKNDRKKPSTEGKLYISSKNNAILKHTRRIEKITLEVSYRKWGDYYFPYFFRSIYPANRKYPFKVVFEAYINRIETKNVSVISKEVLKGWHLSDVPYNASFWEINYPIKQ